VRTSRTPTRSTFADAREVKTVGNCWKSDVATRAPRALAFVAKGEDSASAYFETCRFAAGFVMIPFSQP